MLLHKIYFQSIEKFRKNKELISVKGEFVTKSIPKG